MKINHYDSPDNKLPPSKRSHSLTLAIFSTMLFGCQTTEPLSEQTLAELNATKTQYGLSISDSHYLNKLTANTQAYNQLFDSSNNPSADAKAHSRMMKALKQHLTTDHVSVSQVRHHAVPFIREDSVDAFSDSLLRTVFEMFAKKLSDEGDDYEELSDEPAYRHEEDYLEQPEALYLNYIDEAKGTKPYPAYQINRKMGMSADFVDITDTTIEFVDSINDCVIDYSYQLDELVEADPKLTKSSEKLVEPSSTYNECKSASQQTFSETIEKAQGYQRQYIDMQNACIKQFDTRLNDLLSPNRKPEEINYDHYDSLYESYNVCYFEVSKRYLIEPATYIYYGTSKPRLDYSQGQIECAETVLNKQKKLAQKGISYKNNPKAYADIYYEYSGCDAEAYNRAYLEDSSSAEAEDETFLETSLIREGSTVEEEPIRDSVVDNSDDESQSDASEYEYEAAEAEVAEAEAEVAEAESDPYETGRGYSEVVNKLFNWFRRTPAQIEAANLYNYQYLSVNNVSEFNATKRQLKSVYSYDFASPTMLSSMQLPIALDFSTGQAIIDPSAVMPIVALLAPEHTPLPEEMSSTTIRFDLPESMTSQLPPEVVFDIVIDSVQKSLADLDNEYFTAMDISEDTFAKQIGARRAIKVNFGSKETGEVVGGFIKYMAQAFNDYTEAHPEKFPDESAIKASIDKWQQYNVSYQTDDAGSILQLIEAVGPVSFNKVNYYYLDSHDRLIGKQVRTKLGGDFMGSESTFLTQTRYDKVSFQQHPLAQLFNESFGPTAAPPMDGNKWLEVIKSKREKLAQARYARYDYEREMVADELDEYDMDTDDLGNDDFDEYNSAVIESKAILNEDKIATQKAYEDAKNGEINTTMSEEVTDSRTIENDVSPE